MRFSDWFTLPIFFGWRLIASPPSDVVKSAAMIYKPSSFTGPGAMTMTVALPNDRLEFLRSIDTPTVCNLIEVVVPDRRGWGYTTRHLHCPFPDLPPMVGFAKTVTIRSKDAVAF